MKDHQTKKVESIFKEANAALDGPSPFLKTRVLAELRERHVRNHVFRWKFASAFAGLLSVVLLVLIFDRNSASFTVQSKEPVLVKVEMENIKSTDIAFAEIVLPEGVRFHSSRFPDLEERRSLTLDWDPGFSSGKLPFVIRSSYEGVGEVKILLKDRNHAVMEEKSIRIRFRG